MSQRSLSRAAGTPPPPHQGTNASSSASSRPRHAHRIDRSGVPRRAHQSRPICDEVVTVTPRDGALAVDFPRARENRLAFTAQQLAVVRCRLEPGVWFVAASALTGKAAVVAQLARVPFLQGKRALLMTRSNVCLNETVTRVLTLGVPVSCVFHHRHCEAELKATTGSSSEAGGGSSRRLRTARRSLRAAWSSRWSAACRTSSSPRSRRCSTS